MWKYFIALLILSLFKIDDVANQDNLPKPGTKPDKGKPDDSKPDEGKPDKASNLNAADPSNPRHPPGPISTSIGSQQRVAECYSLVRKLDCKFYTCLSERLICPQTLLAKEKPNVYCKGPDEKVNLWMEAVVECYMTKLRDLYSLVTVTCNFVDKILIDMQKQCYLENAFCLVGWTNRDSLLQLFKKAKTKLVPNVYNMLWGNISDVAANCSTDTSGKFHKWLKEQQSLP